jgi:type I restriction enzyme S subunit
MTSHNWQKQALGELLDLEYGDGLTKEERSGEGYPVYGSSGTIGKHSNYLIEGPGIIVGRKGTVGAVEWSDENFWPIDTTYYVRPKSAVAFRWLYWLLLHANLGRLDASTGVPGLNRHEAYTVDVDVPPLSEQRRIAEILDAADAAIRETERVIAKLREIQQGLLHDLLTRGLDDHGHLRDPDAHPEQFKDSPLGRIPRAWTMQPISELGRVVTGTTPPGSADDAWGDALPFITPTEITNDGFVEKAERSISKEGKKYIRLIPEDSVMVVCIGSTLGKVGIAKSNCATNQQINSVIVEGHNSIFAYAAIRNNVEQLKKITGLQAVPIVNKSKFSSVLVPVAPLDEQRRIAAVLDAHDARIRAEEAVLAKHRQVKRGLMDDLLTGRVRV